MLFFVISKIHLLIEKLIKFTETYIALVIINNVSIMYFDIFKIVLKGQNMPQFGDC